MRGYNPPVIKVTRLNGKEFVVNADLIQYLEETPDTIITLVNHEKVVVKEKVDEVIRRVNALEELSDLRELRPFLAHATA